MISSKRNSKIEGKQKKEIQNYLEQFLNLNEDKMAAA